MLRPRARILDIFSNMSNILSKVGFVLDLYGQNCRLTYLLGVLLGSLVVLNKELLLCI